MINYFRKKTSFYLLSLFFLIFFIFFISSTSEAKKKLNLNKLIIGMFVGEDLHPKYGTYQEIILPISIYAGDPELTDFRRKAVEKVVYRFVKKQSTLAYHPDKAIEGIIWLEVLYNEMIKKPKSIRASMIRDIWQAREDIRKSMGFQNIESTQEVINRYILLANLLKGAEVTDQEVDPDLLARKELLKNLKSNIGKAKKNYLNSMDDKELERFEKKAFENTSKANISSTPSKTTQSISTSSDIKTTIQTTPSTSTNDNDVKNKLQQLKALFDEGVITEDVYNTKQLEILDEM